MFYFQAELMGKPANGNTTKNPVSVQQAEKDLLL